MHSFLLFLIPLQLLVQAVPPEVDREELLLQAAAHLRLGYPDGARGLLAAVETPEPGDSLAAIRDLLEGRSRILLGEPAVATARLVPHVDDARPAVSFFARLYLAEAHHAEARHAEALELLEILWGSEGADGDRETLCRVGLEAALSLAEKPLVEGWLDRFSNRCNREKSQVLTARIRAAAVLGEEATRSCGELFTRYPCAPLPEGCDGGSLLDGLSPRDRFERAEGLYECWAYQEAADEFERFLKEDRYRRYHDRCHFLLGEVHSRKLRDDRAAAFEHYRHVYRKGGGPRDYALYQMGRCQMNLEKYGEAVKLFEEYIRRYPKGAHAERCHYYLGWLPYDHDRLEEALPGFDRYLAAYPKGELRTYILWFRAWSLYRLGRLAEATEGFERLAGFGNDIVAGKAWYWLGRSAVTMKKPEAAEAWYRKVVDRYPLSYYGMLSLRALGEMGTTSANPLLDEEALPELERPLPGQADRYLSPSLKERMGPVLDAVLLGEVRAARRWFEPLESAFDRDVRERSAEAHYWLLSLLEEPQKMREWGRRNKRQRGRQPDAENRLGWAFEFPQAYLRLIEVQAARTGLPEVFLYSIMRQESRYRRGVVSWADAVGLLQVIPPTGSRTAQRLGISFDRAELPQPEVNIRLGSSYLGFLARDFHTQLTLVAASYNAGPQPIREFVNANADGGWDYLVEEIAYNEARNYCRKVTGHVLKYLATYAPAAERRRVFALLFPDPPRFDVGEDVTW